MCPSYQYAHVLVLGLGYEYQALLSVARTTDRSAGRWVRPYLGCGENAYAFAPAGTVPEDASFTHLHTNSHPASHFLFDTAKIPLW